MQQLANITWLKSLAFGALELALAEEAPNI